MFMMSVEQLANEEQERKWGPLMQELKIIGCYAQTELGHGSNVAVRIDIKLISLGIGDNCHI
jgi:alkylation response protein AidB-like acyl-CoA dehydrogenase